jgi:hypothetical protein
MAIESSESYAEKFFKDENVWVFVPIQDEPGGLEIVKLDMPDPSTLPEDSGEFKLKRTVVNFEVKRDGSAVEQFSPPIELRVGLLQDEVEELRNGGKFKLAFCLEDGDKWVVLKDIYGFKFDLAARDAIAWIRDWGDATVGLGR